VLLIQFIGFAPMQAAVARTRARPSPARGQRPPPPVVPTPEQDIEAAFLRFRESAVRLVEQVNDRLELMPRVEEETDLDLKLTRAIFGKWSADLLLILHRTPTAGFEDLRRSLGGISARVLSIKLKDLEDIGVVRREIVDARPPRVRYSLTERGWTVAWLAQPIVLYIRLTDRSRRGAPKMPPFVDGGPDSHPPTA
jgi:DNA-binding HxlR family transcriptional regulator